MRILTYRRIREFGERFPDADEALRDWYQCVEKEHWRTPMDVKAWDRRASVLKGSRVVFNICGNRYRLVVAIAYAAETVYIRWFGTHAHYDTINADSV